MELKYFSYNLIYKEINIFIKLCVGAHVAYMSTIIGIPIAHIMLNTNSTYYVKYDFIMLRQYYFYFLIVCKMQANGGSYFVTFVKNSYENSRLLVVLLTFPF